jgi:hypothetical protein
MDVVATVVSDDVARAPFSGVRAAVIVVEAVKGEEVVGIVVFGDLLRLRWEAGELEILARHATYSFTSMWQAPPAAERVPAELVPMLQRGATAFRERLIKSGDRLRVRRAGADGGVRIDEVLPFDP